MVIVGIVSTLAMTAAINLVSLPEHDEFAYFANALYMSGIHPSTSGMSFNGENYSITFIERPPLFWWLLTALFSLGLRPLGALMVSPMFGVLNAMLITMFAYELTGEVKTGLFAGVLAGISGFGASVSVHIMSDAMGSFFAALAMFSFYEYYFKERRYFAILIGASMGLGLVARDEDLITLLLLVFFWILFAPRTGLRKKASFLALFVAFLGIPVLLFGFAGTLQLFSYLLTPIILDGWPFILLAGSILTFVALKTATRFRIAEMGASVFSLFLVMTPFFSNNYTLGNIDFYITGKGVLARPISHLEMIPQTGGVGARLAEVVRMAEWIKAIPALLSIPVVVAMVIGIFYFAGLHKKSFLFLFLWTLVSLAFVAGGTTLEDRFLLIAFTPIMILAGMGLSCVWRKDFVIGTVFAALSFALGDVIPRAPVSILNLTLVGGFRADSRNWLFSFLPRITLGAPQPKLGYPLLVDGLVSLPLAVVALAMGFCLSGSHIADLEPLSLEEKEQHDIIAQNGEVMLGIRQDEIEITENKPGIARAETKQNSGTSRMVDLENKHSTGHSKDFRCFEISYHDDEMDDVAGEEDPDFDWIFDSQNAFLEKNYFHRANTDGESGKSKTRRVS
jgi:4-amino-4-deoxy-L-arabinose transferase-like glycosyltransferase